MIDAPPPRGLVTDRYISSSESVRPAATVAAPSFVEPSTELSDASSVLKVTDVSPDVQTAEISQVSPACVQASAASSHIP